jgi:GTP-binding protein
LDTPLTWENERVMLIDTAGLRQRGRVATQLEHYSVLRALRAIERSDVVVLLLDAGQGLVAQDAHIGGYVADRGRGLVLVVNKWDLVPPQIRDQVRAQYRSSLGQLFRFAPYAPVYLVSALTAEGTAQVLRAALNVERERRREVAADELKEWLREATARHSPPASKGRAVRFFDVSQTGTSPPTLSFGVSDPQAIHFSYQRYLENALRQAFGFSGTPVRLIFRKGTASARRRPS